MLPNLPHPASNLESHKNNLKQRRQISFTASRPLLNLRIDSESLPRPNIYYESNDPRSEEQNQRDPPSLHSAKTSLDCRQTAGERGLLSASGSRLTGRNYSSMKSPVARTSPIIARQVVTGDLYQSVSNRFPRSRTSSLVKLGDTKSDLNFSTRLNPKYHGELGPSCENKIFNDESSDQSRRTNNPPVKGGARQYPIDSGSTSEEYADYDEIIYPHVSYSPSPGGDSQDPSLDSHENANYTEEERYPISTEAGGSEEHGEEEEEEEEEEEGEEEEDEDEDDEDDDDLPKTSSEGHNYAGYQFGVYSGTMTEASLKRSAKASFSTEAHVASQSDDSSLSNHTDDLLINPKAGIGPAPDCESNEPWLAMQSRRVPTINGGLPSYDSPRRRSSSPLPKYGASPLCSPAENAESTQGERRWIENFYVWIYDQPVTSPITAGHPLEGSLNNTSPSSQNLSNQLIGGISRHFFNYTGLKPSTSSSENKMPKLPGKKAGRAKKGLMSLAHRPKDSANSQMLESSNLFIPSIGESEKPSLDPQSLSERLDALVDRTVGAEVLRISGTSCYNLQELEVCQSNKSKKSSSSTKTGKLNNKKGLSGSVEASIVRQLALGPGPAMNSSGFGAGKWKLVQGIITEDGHFTLYTNDNVMLHRIYLPSYRRTDIRMVHQSIFGRLHCGVISRRGANGQSPNQSIPPTKTSCYSDSSIGAPMHDTKLSGVGAQLPSKSTLGASLSNNAFNSLTNQNLNVTSPTLVEVSNYSDNNLVTSGAVTPNSIYICMPNSVLIESWLVICKCFCRPDDFRHLYPRSSSRKNVCHHQNSKAQDLSKNHNESNFSHRGSSLKASSSKLTFDASGQVNSREQLYQLPERVRIWRGVEITLLEGKRIGELRCSESSQKPLAIFKMDETPHQEELRRNSLGGGLSYKDIQNNHNFKSNRPWNGSSINSNFDQNNSTSSKIKLEGNQTTAFSSFATPSLNPKQQGNNYTSKIRQTANPRSDKINKRLSGNIDDRKNLGVNNFYFVEMIWDKEVIGRSTIKRNSSPYWKEDFKFTDLGSFKTPLTLNVYQIKKNLKQQINLIGSTKVDFKNLVKGRSLDIWLPIHPDKLTTEEQSEEIRAAIDKNLENKIVGELNISVMLYEQIVLGHGEYSRMLELLNDDKDIDLAYDLANLASNDLERLGELLLRIYDCNDKLLLRLAQMATIEVDGDTTTASILFRGNTLLTKILESYMRMVGSSFLESSIGPIIRRVCIRKTELEIDPSKLRVSGNNRDRVLTENARELNQLSTEIWESMYLHRSKCPSQLRRVFFRIQELVSISYSDPDMRLISISAFIFLRFFVPAILNPRLFNLIQFQPDSKSQRTLTLLAKTLQGLGNMNQFGTKEPWMNVMNEFVKSQSDSFRDYISFISQQPEVNRPEWTSKDYESYKLPLALRTSLPPSSREGVPFLPHLLDLGRDCSLLSSLISSAVDKAATNGWNIFQEQMNRTSETYSTSILEFLSVCQDLHSKSERRYIKIIQSETKETVNGKGDLIYVNTASLAPNQSTQSSSSPEQINLMGGGRSPNNKLTTVSGGKIVSPTESGFSPQLQRKNSGRSKRSQTISTDNRNNLTINKHFALIGEENVDTQRFDYKTCHQSEASSSASLSEMLQYKPNEGAQSHSCSGSNQLNSKSSFMLHSPTGNTVFMRNNPLAFITSNRCEPGGVVAEIERVRPVGLGKERNMKASYRTYSAQSTPQKVVITKCKEVKTSTCKIQDLIDACPEDRCYQASTPAAELSSQPPLLNNGHSLTKSSLPFNPPNFSSYLPQMDSIDSKGPNKNIGFLSPTTHKDNSQLDLGFGGLILHDTAQSSSIDEGYKKGLRCSSNQRFSVGAKDDNDWKTKSDYEDGGVDENELSRETQFSLPLAVSPCDDLSPQGYRIVNSLSDDMIINPSNASSNNLGNVKVPFSPTTGRTNHKSLIQKMMRKNSTAK